MTDGWTLAARARREFADMIDGLSPEQSTADSLCHGWNVHHVAAHLVTFVDVPLPNGELTGDGVAILASRCAA